MRKLASFLVKSDASRSMLSLSLYICFYANITYLDYSLLVQKTLILEKKRQNNFFLDNEIPYVELIIISEEKKLQTTYFLYQNIIYKNSFL